MDIASQVLAQRPDLRVSLLTLEPGQEFPWHDHTEVSDLFVCATGKLRIEAREPDETVVLAPGETFLIAARRAHRVSAKGTESCRYVIVQDGGAYDFNPIAD
jgi:quercetin dioxygenase-like cupin family protein